MEETEMKKLIAMLLAIVMLVSLAACGAKTEAPAPEAPKADAPVADAPVADAPAAPAKPYEGVTINVLGNSSTDSSFMQEYLDEFTAETGIKVNYEQLTNDQLNTKITVSMAAGGADLDVFMYMAYQNTGMYVQNGWLEPLDGYVDAEFDVSDYMQSGLDFSSVDGKLYGIPHGSEYGIIFYNKTMIDEAGINVDEIKTWEDLVAACATVEEKLPGTKGIAIRGQGNGAVTMVINLARAYGGEYIVDGKAAINTPEFCKGVEVYRDLLQYSQEGASAMSWSETCNVFAQKQTAFRFDSDAQYTYLIDEASSLVKEEELGFFALPTGDACASTTCGNWSIGISSGSKNKEAAWEFVRWMNTKEAIVKRALEFAAQPARSSAWQNEEVKAVYPAGFADVTLVSGTIAGGGALPNMLYSGEARTAIGEAYDAIFAGDDIQKNMDEANAIMQELLDQEAAEK